MMKFYVLKVQNYNDDYKDRGGTVSYVRYGKTERELKNKVIDYLNEDICYRRDYYRYTEEMYEDDDDVQKYYEKCDGKYVLKYDIPDEFVKRIYDVVTEGEFVSRRWSYVIQEVEIVGDCEDFIVDGKSQNNPKDEDE